MITLGLKCRYHWLILSSDTLAILNINDAGSWHRGEGRAGGRIESPSYSDDSGNQQTSAKFVPGHNCVTDIYCAARKMETMRIRQSHIDFLSWLCNGHLSKWYLDMSCIIQIERLYHPTFIWYHHSRRIATTRPSRQGHKEPVTGSKLRPRSNFHPLTSHMSPWLG